jgi:hypothetical protein
MEGYYEGKEGEGEKVREKIIVANRATEAWNTTMQLVLTVNYSVLLKQPHQFEP